MSKYKEDLEMYNAIPEDLFWLKKALPLCVNLWDLFKIIGWEQFLEKYDAFMDAIIDELAARCEEAIAVTK